MAESSTRRQEDETQSVHDVRQDRLSKAAAEALGNWFTDQGVLNKLVRHLSYDELRSAAVACVSGWLVADSRERHAEFLEESKKRLAAVSQPLI